MSINSRIAAFFLASTLPLVSMAAMPEKSIGIWAAENSVFNGDVFLGGLALYVDRDGTAILLGGALPAPDCHSMQCAKVGGMKMQVHFGADMKSIIVTSKDPSGKETSGIGFIYDDAANVLHGEMLSVQGKTLHRKTASVAKEFMRSIVEASSLQEKDLPVGRMTYIVPSHGMAPTLDIGQMVLADTYIYTVMRPQRGDIIVYESVKNRRDIYMQRIIGLPGDTVEIRDAMLILNGEKVTEPYASPNTMRMPLSKVFAKITVPQDTFFLLGDNRDGSLDSRFQGPIALTRIAGKVYMVRSSQFEGEFIPTK